MMIAPRLPRSVSARSAPWVLWVAAGLAIATGLACSSDSDPYNRLTTLRVLALRSEPAVPLSGETATLSALVYTPPPDPLAPSGLDPTLTYAWSWCPFPGPAGQGYPCLLTNEGVQAATEGTAPALDLGHGPTASLPYTIDSADLKRLCKAAGGTGGTGGTAGAGGAGGVPGGIEQLAQLDCTGGVPIQIKLVVKTDGDPKGVTSVFTMRLGLEATDANANPAIAGLEVLQNGAGVAIDAANTGGVTLTRDIENPLQLPADLVNQSEKYLGTDDNDHPAMVDERLFVTWFVETGDTKDQATGLIVGTSDPQVFLHDTWTPAVVKKYPRTTARILLVLRDNRAGVGWYEGRVNLAEAPQ
jgi:hypothetical protein